MNNKNKARRISKRICTFIISAVMVVMLSVTAFAEDGGIASSIIATGTKQLISDVSGWLTGIAIAVTAVVCVYLFIRRAMSDEQDKKQWDNRLKITAVSGIGAITATALIGVIAGYFGGGAA